MDRHESSSRNGDQQSNRNSRSQGRSRNEGHNDNHHDNNESYGSEYRSSDYGRNYGEESSRGSDRNSRFSNDSGSSRNYDDRNEDGYSSANDYGRSGNHGMNPTSRDSSSLRQYGESGSFGQGGHSQGGYGQDDEGSYSRSGQPRFQNRSGFGSGPQQNYPLQRDEHGRFMSNHSSSRGSGHTRSDSYGDFNSDSASNRDFDRGSFQGGQNSGRDQFNHDSQSLGRFGQNSQSQSSEQGRFYGVGPKDFKRSDDRLKEEINEQLTYHHEVDASQIKIDVKGGEVTLQGTVPNKSMKRHAEDLIEAVFGVKDVRNELRVAKNSGTNTEENEESASEKSSRQREAKQ